MAAGRGDYPYFMSRCTRGKVYLPAKLGYKCVRTNKADGSATFELLGIINANCENFGRL